MKLINTLLVATAIWGISAQASINDKKEFDRLYPAKYDNAATLLNSEVKKISKINQLITETPFIEATKKGGDDETKRKEKPSIQAPEYPTVLQDMRAAGYEFSSSLPYHAWYSLSIQPTWSLDDKENYAELINILPGKDEWKDAEFLPKGREINIKFILMNTPDIKKLGKFRTYYQPSSSTSYTDKMAGAAYKREQAKAEKAVAQSALSGYACITVKKDDAVTYGWIKLSSLLPNAKGKKKKKK